MMAFRVACLFSAADQSIRAELAVLVGYIKSEVDGKVQNFSLLASSSCHGSTDINTTHLPLLISWKEKMCLGNDSNNFFELLRGQLKSRI